MKTNLMIMLSLFSIFSATAQGFKSLNNADFEKLIAKKSTQLVDVRTEGEFGEGHIPGAVNIDVQSDDFDQKIDSLDKQRTIAVYCRSGARSKKAAKKLTAKGFQVVDLDNGITGWKGTVVK